MVITGGADGIMRAAQEGAGRENSFGVNIMLPFEQGPNTTIADDPKLVTFKYFFTRKLFLVKEASGVALFPGGFGTMDETFELLTLMQTGKSALVPVVLVEAGPKPYWRIWHRWIAGTLVERGLIDAEDTSYKSLKAVLEGGIEGRPDNVVFYATSNRRHLMPRDMIENERSTAINPSEAVEEKVSLSDRFGLWLGFHNADQDTFFAMIEAYAAHYKLGMPVEELRKRAVEWSITRGSRSGRVAWQFVQEIAGELGKRLD